MSDTNLSPASCNLLARFWECLVCVFKFLILRMLSGPTWDELWKCLSHTGPEYSDYPNYVPLMCDFSLLHEETLSLELTCLRLGKQHVFPFLKDILDPI